MHDSRQTVSNMILLQQTLITLYVSDTQRMQTLVDVLETKLKLFFKSGFHSSAVTLILNKLELIDTSTLLYANIIHNL